MDLIEIIYLIAVSFAFGSVFLIITQVKTEQFLLVTYLWGYLLILGISNLMLLFMMTGWMTHFPSLFKIFMPLSYLSPVFSYYYIRGSLGYSYFPHKWEYLHYVPFLLVTIHYFPFLLVPIEEKKLLVQSVIENSKLIVSHSYGWIFSESQIFFFRTIQTIIYLILSFRILYSFKKTNFLLNNRSMLIFNWLKIFLFSMVTYQLVIILCYLLFLLDFKGVVVSTLIENLTFFFTSIFVLFLSAFIMFHPKLLLAIQRPVDYAIDNEINSKINLIEVLSRDELFKNSDLKVDHVLNHLNLSHIELITLIRTEGFNNFNELINDLRLNCFLKIATSESLNLNSIEGVAKECGFKSPSTFYRVFKQKFKKTPSNYLKDQSLTNI